MASFVNAAVLGRSNVPAAFGLSTKLPKASSSRLLLHQLRGGGSDGDEEDEESNDDDSDSDSDTASDSNEASDDGIGKGSIRSSSTSSASVEAQEDDDSSAGAGQQGHPMSTVMSMEPVAVVVKTNTGNPVLDQTVEFTVHPSRDVASVKQTLRRLLPGKPPVSMLKLVQSNVVLQDDLMVNELLDDDDDDEEEQEDDEDDDEGGRKKKKLVLQLDMVPPVDPKFVVQLALQMPEMTVSDLLDAYAMNEAAAYVHATAIMMSPNQQQHDEDDQDREDEVDAGGLTRSTALASASVTRQIKEQAAIIRRDLEESLLQSEPMQKVIQEGKAPAFHLPNLQERQVRGQRVRQAAQGGVKTTLKRKIQRNLNVNWVDTLRHFCLFLFFGYFGGRTPFSRAVLLLGAPSVFLLQARFVKLWIRQALYALVDHPPSILLSLLPAPQQSILSLDVRAAMETIYGDYAVELRRKGSSSRSPQEEDEDAEEEESEDDDTFVEESDDDESEDASDDDE
jgi:hypothetical protein